MTTHEPTWHGRKITTWAQFHAHVKPGRKLLERLDEFPGAVLVAGCQRSGTTAVARMLYECEGVGMYRFGKDDELDAALLLSGHVEMPRSGRGVFQTTYLNDRVSEYFEHRDYRLVWILREPTSVVYSMLFNWRRGALERLYDACGRRASGAEPSGLRGRVRDFATSSFEKACASYLAKTSQTFELTERLGDRICVVDYNELVVNKAKLLPGIFDFAGLPFRPQHLQALHAGSLHRQRWSDTRARRIEQMCGPIYERAKALADARCAG